MEDIEEEINDTGKKRLEEIKNAMEVCDIFGADGLVDRMPLGEAIGFMDAVLGGERRASRKETTEEEKEKLGRAFGFLSDLDKEEYPEKMELGAVLEKFKEERDILGGV